MNRIKSLAIVLAVVAVLIYLVPGCDELITEVNEITLAGHPIAEFSADKDAGCVPCTVTFFDISQGPYQYGVFSFGDNTPDSEATFDPDSTGTFVHVYEGPGTYTVSLTVYDTVLPDTAIDMETKARFLIIGPLSADFDTDTTGGCPGLEVTFTNIAQTTITKWEWDFGDGGDTTFVDSTPDTVTYTYTTTDTFVVVLTTTGDCGTTDGADTIIIIDCLEPAFSMSVPDSCTPLSIDFRDTTQPTAAARIWTFGDGRTSILEDETITFDSGGVYLITLSVSETVGGPSTSVSDTLVLYDRPDAEFVVDGSSASCYLPSRQFHVRFVDQTPGDVISRTLYFGDGTMVTDDTIPIHAYTTPGRYTCSLVVVGMCGEDTIVSTKVHPDLVVLSDTLYENSIGFSMLPDSGTLATEFTFVDTSRGVIIDRAWVVADSLVNDTIQVSRVFPDTGWQQIAIQVSNGCNDVSFIDSVYVDTVPNP